MDHIHAGAPRAGTTAPTPGIEAQPGHDTGQAGDAGHLDNAGHAGNVGNVCNVCNAGNVGNVGNIGNVRNVGNVGNASNTDTTGNATMLPAVATRAALESGFLSALRNNDATAVAGLLDCGLGADRPLQCRASPVVLAAREGRPAILALLLQRCASPALNDQGNAALWEAVKSRRDDVVTMLLACGRDARQADSAGETLLMLAARTAEPETVGRLIKAGGDIDAQDRSGMSAILYAMREGRLDNVRLLLDHHARLDLKHDVVFNVMRNDAEFPNLSRQRLGGFVEVLLEQGVSFNLGNWVCEENIVAAELLRLRAVPADLLLTNGHTPLSFIDAWIAALEQLDSQPVGAAGRRFCQRMLLAGLSPMNAVWLRHALGRLYAGTELWVPLAIQCWPLEPVETWEVRRHPPTPMQKRMLCAALLASLDTEVDFAEELFEHDGVSMACARHCCQLAEQQRKVLIAFGQAALDASIGRCLDDMNLRCQELLSCEGELQFDDLEQALRQQAGLWQPFVALVTAAAEHAVAQAGTLARQRHSAGEDETQLAVHFRQQWSAFFHQSLGGKNWEECRSALLAGIGAVCNANQFVEGMRLQLALLTRFFERLVQAQPGD
ncbi:MAG: ankyrin repeat domain-containing protein [Janthinobacterium lividum]